MSAGIKANVDGSGAIQVGGTDVITISSAGAVAIPQTLSVAGAITQGGNPVVPQVQTQTLSSGSSSWSKPTNGGYQGLKIQIWGGGGSGGRGNNTGGGVGSGGGGGSYNEITVPLSYLASSESYTVGAGGAGTAGLGNTGGTSSFTMSNYLGGAETIFGYGGGRGSTDNVAGGGGGIAGNGGGSTVYNYGGPYIIGQTADALANLGISIYGGGAGSTAARGIGFGSVFGGAGGGSASGSTTNSPGGAGGTSFYGGGGGGGAPGGAGVPGAGGLSKYGGNGGAGALSTTPAAGQIPGGGGGGVATTATSGAGGDGQIRLTWW
jgi:hypothetical protein